MSAFIDNATRIIYQRQVSIAQTKSQSGKRQAQRRSPLLYNFTVEYFPMAFGSDEYYAMEDAIIDTNYSTTVITTTITNGDLFKPRGLWTGTPVVKGADQAGNSIIIDGASANRLNWARKGDFVQFNGLTKVFQVTDDANSDTNGDVTLKLNGAIPSGGSPGDNTTVTFGENVEFRLAMMDRPEPTHSDGVLVFYSNGRFEEVIA